MMTAKILTQRRQVAKTQRFSMISLRLCVKIVWVRREARRAMNEHVKKSFQEATMTSQSVTWEVPENLYRELVWAQHELAYPDLVDFITQAVQRRLAEIKREAWQRDFRQLQREISAAGGFGLGKTKAEVIAHLREIRRQIYAEDYAHLY